MDLLEMLKKRLSPLYPGMQQQPAIDTVQHEGVVAAGAGSLTMDGGPTDGEGTSGLGAALGSLAGQGMGALMGGKGAAPVEAEKLPLGQVSDLNLRKPEALPIAPDFKSQAHGSSNMAPAATMPGIAAAPSAAPPAAEEGGGIGSVLGGLGSGLKSLGGGLASNIGGDALDLMKLFKFGGARAYGGPVDPRKKYRVNEFGQEVFVGEDGSAAPVGNGSPGLFVPEQPGTIVPNGDLPQQVQAEQIPLGTQISPQQQLPMPGQPTPAEATPAMPTPAVPVEAPLSRREQLEKQIADIEGKDYSIKKIVNPDGTVTKIRGKHRDDDHNILDILKGIGLGALKGGAQNGLAGLISGAATGGIMSGIDRNYDEKVMDEWKTQGLRGDLNVVREGEMADAKISEQSGKAANQQREYSEGIYKNTEAALAADGVIDENESMLLSSLRRRMSLPGEVAPRDDRKGETITDDSGNTLWTPEKGKPNYEATNAPVQGGQVRSSVSLGGELVSLSPSERVQLEVGNAARSQQAQVQNVNNKLEADKANMAAETAWHKDRLDRQTAAIETLGKTMENNAEVQAINVRIQGLNAKASAAAEAGDMETFNTVLGEMNEAQSELESAANKTAAGSQMVQMLTKLNRPKPTKVTPGQVTAEKIGQKVGTRADVQEFAKTNNWTYEQALEYVTRNGWTVK